MGLFSSFYTGTSGMNAQSKSTSIISTNIANITTVGYKRSDTAFHDLVTNEKTGSINMYGGVTANRIQRIDGQGPIQQTGIKLDTSISGRGFFAARGTPDQASTERFVYTRNGQMEEFATGNGNETFLRNTAGFYIYGWQLDEFGNLPADTTTTGGLVPIQLSPAADEILLPTTIGEFALNLNGGQQPIDPLLRPAGLQTLPVSYQSVNGLPDDSAPSHYTRTLSVYSGVTDAYGNNTRELTFEFRRITGPQAHFTSNTSTPLNGTDILVDNPTGPTPGITAGETLTINGGANPVTITFVNGVADTSLNQANRMSDVITIINNVQNAGEQVYDATIDGTGRFVVRAIDPAVTLDLTANTMNVLGATGFAMATDPDAPGDYTYEPETASYADQALFPQLENPAQPQNWWEMRILRAADPAISSPEIPDPLNPGTMIPNPLYDPLNPEFEQRVEVVKGLINFNGDGTLNMVDGTGVLTLPTIDFDSSMTGEELTIAMDISGMAQMTGVYTAIVTEQNGAEVGHRTSTEIRSDGTVVGVYSNGQTAQLYRIPVATFVNENGLTDLTGTVFAESQDSGAYTLQTAGTGAAGIMNPSTIENSNVDLGDEFAKLIVSQRAFSANSQVVQTVNEMTQYLAQLSR